MVPIPSIPTISVRGGAGVQFGDQFYAYLKDSFDTLYAEGATAPKMLSIGLHCRLVGRPGRAASLARFLDYVAAMTRSGSPRGSTSPATGFANILRRGWKPRK